ncbi:hypothetical protein HK096_006532, partial [Nowakowskiella sp. JEL0078]
MPEIMDDVIVEAIVDEIVTNSLSFSNPFIDPISIHVSLTSNCTSNPFSLIQNKRKTHAGPFELVQVPFIYHPKDMIKAEAKIILEMSEQLKWVYPIK